MISINRKGLDLHLALPAGWQFAEGEVRKRMGAVLGRGHVTARVHFAPSEQGQLRQKQQEEERLASLLLLWRSRAARLGLAEEQITLPFLVEQFRQGGREESAEEFFPEPDEVTAFYRAIDQALQQLVAGKEREGTLLEAVLSSHVAEVASCTERVAAIAPAWRAAQAQRLLELLGRSCSEIGLKQETTEQALWAHECARLADRADVSEELDRIRAHLQQCRELIAGPSEGGVGKKLEFWVQELSREWNTLHAKMADVQVATIGSEARAALDRLREQILNIE